MKDWDSCIEYTKVRNRMFCTSPEVRDIFRYLSIHKKKNNDIKKENSEFFCKDVFLTGFSRLLLPPFSRSRLHHSLPLSIPHHRSRPTLRLLRRLRNHGFYHYSPFHELDYSWNFGDDDTATWTYGSNPGVNKKNRAYGPESAHVFETPGTFTVTLSVYDGTDTATTTQEIIVTDPDTVFAGNTFCINASGTDHTGCPLIPGTYADSAACITAGKCLTQASFSTAITTYATAGRRVLFKKGDSFSNDAANIHFVGTLGLISSYGTGAKPIVVNAVNSDIFDFTADVSDWRLMNLDFDLNMGNISRFMSMTGSLNVNKLLIMNNDVHDGFGGFTQTGGGVSAFDQIAFIGNTFTNLTTYPDELGVNGTAVYAYGARMSYMGTPSMGRSHTMSAFPRSNGESSVIITSRKTASPTLAQIEFRQI
jgi:diadenosine tetraphosphatase ApaH/serine/threonine PP2A family protein phosphatase